MAIFFADRVRVTTSTVGTGTLSLGSALAGFRSFAQASIPTGSTVYYSIEEAANWETGSGIYTVGTPDSLTRIVASSSAGGTTPITLSGAAQVYLTLTAAAVTTGTTKPPDTNTTDLATTAYVIGQASQLVPLAHGTPVIGSLLSYARANHVHPNTMSNGINFGSVTGSSTTDLTKHIDLYGGQYGLSITGGRLNLIAPASQSISFVNGGATVGSVTGTGLNACAIGATTASTGAFTSVSAGTAGSGSVLLTPGDATHTGSISFFNAAGVRNGYMGLGSSGALSLVVADGSSTQLVITGALNVTGSASCANLFSSGAVTGNAFTVNAGLSVPGGNVSVSNSLIVNGTTYFSSTQTGNGYQAFADAAGRYLRFTADNWQIMWRSSDGALIYYNQAGQPMFYSLSGNFYVWNTVQPNQSSDVRTKRDIQPYTRGLVEINQLNPVTFKFNGLGTTTDDGVQKYGLLAHETETAMPECVFDTVQPPMQDGSDPRLPDQKSVDKDPILFALINAVKELSARVVALEARLA